jgi:hypothetical protein
MAHVRGNPPGAFPFTVLLINMGDGSRGDTSHVTSMAEGTVRLSLGPRPPATLFFSTSRGDGPAAPPNDQPGPRATQGAVCQVSQLAWSAHGVGSNNCANRRELPLWNQWAARRRWFVWCRGQSDAWYWRGRRVVADPISVRRFRGTCRSPAYSLRGRRASSRNRSVLVDWVHRLGSSGRLWRRERHPPRWAAAGRQASSPIAAGRTGHLRPHAAHLSSWPGGSRHSWRWRRCRSPSGEPRICPAR